MRTSPDPDSDLEIPEIDFSKVTLRPNPLAARPGEKTEIAIDRAVAYELRLIPSRKVLGRFESTLGAWPAVIAAVESGRSPRTLSLDAIGPEGERWHMAAGRFLERFARFNNGDVSASVGRAGAGRRVAEGTA